MVITSQLIDEGYQSITPTDVTADSWLYVLAATFGLIAAVAVIVIIYLIHLIYECECQYRSCCWILPREEGLGHEEADTEFEFDMDWGAKCLEETATLQAVYTLDQKPGVKPDNEDEEEEEEEEEERLLHINEEEYEEIINELDALDKNVATGAGVSHAESEHIYAEVEEADPDHIYAEIEEIRNNKASHAEPEAEMVDRDNKVAGGEKPDKTRSKNAAGAEMIESGMSSDATPSHHRPRPDSPYPGGRSMPLSRVRAHVVRRHDCPVPVPVPMPPARLTASQEPGYVVVTIIKETSV